MFSSLSKNGLVSAHKVKLNRMCRCIRFPLFTVSSMSLKLDKVSLEWSREHAGGFSVSFLLIGFKLCVQTVFVQKSFKAEYTASFYLSTNNKIARLWT